MSLFNIILIICISSVVLLFIIRKKGDKQDILSYVSTLMATLFGVLLAVLLANNSNEIKEKEDTIKLINTANTIVVSTYDNTKIMHDYLDALNKDSIDNTDKVRVITDLNPLPYPEMLQSILTNEIVSKNISEQMQNEIYSTVYDLRKMCDYKYMPDYEYLLEVLSLSFKLEVEYQKGNIDLDTMEIKYNNGVEELDKKYSVFNTGTINLDR